MARRLATRGEGGRTRGSEQENPGRPSRWPHGAQANAGKCSVPWEQPPRWGFQTRGMRGAELAAFGVRLRAQRRLTGRAPRQTGTTPHPHPTGLGSRRRGPRGAVRPQTAAADPRGVQSRRGGGFPPPCGPSSLSRAGLEQPVRALGERGRRLDGRPEGPGHLPMGRTPPGLRCPLPGASAGVCGSAARGRAPRRRSLEPQPEHRSSSGL